MSSTIKLFDKNSMTLLFECGIDEIETAYQKAHEFEEFGIDVLLKSPSLPETLIRGLGATDEHVNELHMAIDEEIQSHIQEDFGCAVCISPSDQSKKTFED